jgi:hypothetical protein
VNAGRCCNSIGERAETRPARPSYLGFAGWMVPGVVLAILPKCPACLAAYVAVGTGLALSAPAAAYLRTTLVALCIGSLAYLGVRRLWRCVVGFGAETRARGASSK